MVLLFNRSKKLQFYNAGMVLVMSLWILALLTAFAVSISFGIRQRIMLISRLEKRAQVHDIAKSGVQVARMVLIRTLEEGDGLDVSAKAMKHNNPQAFQDIAFDGGTVEVSYLDYGRSGPESGTNRIFGMEDEAGKLNLNTAAVMELTRLFEAAAGLEPGDARDLAKAIVDWRGMGSTETFGFVSDNYYESLNFPYKPKNMPFEVLEEVLLVKKMNPLIFEQVRDFITVYGDGTINLNTASSVVLLALGLSPKMVSAVIAMRNGADGLPATGDDYFFKDRRVSVYLDSLTPGNLDESEKGLVLSIDNKLTTKSRICRAKVKAVLDDGKETRFIDCVLDGRDARILAWREY